MLLRLAYLGVTNAFAMLRLLPMSTRDKDVEILALRHQITVLQRQLGHEKVRFVASDRALLAASPLTAQLADQPGLPFSWSKSFPVGRGCDRGLRVGR